jgi:hypothetical protein
MTTLINHNELKEQVREEIVLTKPTIQEIITTYIKVHQDLEANGKRHSFNDDDVLLNPWKKITKQNEKYLSVMDLEDYNHTNFDKLIASIELNGKKHFNMQMFIGVVDNLDSHFKDDLDSRAYGDETTSHGLHGDWISTPSSKYSPFYGNTKTFNCDTVGCIAGFAVANALDWEEDLIRQASDYYYNQQYLFENIACNFLNMPINIGKKLFYAEGNSFWAMLANRSWDFPDTTDIGIFRLLDVQDYIEDDFLYDPIELASITHEMAAKALRLIRDGLMLLSMNDTPYLNFDYVNQLNESDKVNI